MPHHSSQAHPQKYKLLLRRQNSPHRENESGGFTLDDEPQETGHPYEPGDTRNRSEKLPQIRAEEERGGDQR